MDVKQVPIPAFYCCYLLRSSQRKASNYVGSTPNPRRRLRQHNGNSIGGASRTSRVKLRPWEMACIVTGFQSRLAALQFEWAWQNAWKSLHISESDRKPLCADVDPKKVSVKTSKSKGPKRTDLHEKLKYLHLILQASSFSRWPLTVHFLIEEVYQQWRRWDERSARHVPKDIEISLDFKMVDEFANIDDLPPSGQPPVSLNARLIDRLDITYQPLKSHLEKSESLLSKASQIECAICQITLRIDQVAVLVCPHSTCKAASHMSCLAKAFLNEDASSENILPISGECPSCGRRTAWSDLIKEMSLRVRGSKERAALMKKPRKRRIPDDVGIEGGVSFPINSDSEDESEPDDEPLDDGWRPLDFDDDDAVSIRTATTDVSDNDSDTGRRPLSKPRLEVVIEDSDDDGLNI